MRWLGPSVLLLCSWCTLACAKAPPSRPDSGQGLAQGPKLSLAAGAASSVEVRLENPGPKALIIPASICGAVPWPSVLTFVLGEGIELQALYDDLASEHPHSALELAPNEVLTARVELASFFVHLGGAEIVALKKHLEREPVTKVYARLRSGDPPLRSPSVELPSAPLKDAFEEKIGPLH